MNGMTELSTQTKKAPNTKAADFSRLQTFVKAHFLLLAIAGSVFIFILGWFGLLRGQYEDIKDAKVHGFVATQQQLDERTQHVQELQQMEQSYTSLNKERLTQLESVVPVGMNPTELIARLEAFAAASDIQLLSIDVAAGGTADSASTGNVTSGLAEALPSYISTATITTNLQTADGSYSTLKEFLAALESFTPLLDLQQFSYSPGTTSYALQLVTYYVTPQL